MNQSVRERAWLAVELAGGMVALSTVAAINGWTIREQIAIATGILHVGASVAAPSDRRPWMALVWIVLIVVPLFGSDPAMTGVACGIVAAGSIAASIVGRDEIPFGRAVCLCAAFVVALHAIPIDRFGLVAVVTGVSSILLLRALRGNRGVEPASVAVVMLFAAIALPLPVEALLLPAVVAAAVAAARSRSIVWCALAVLIAFAAGKWLVPPVAVICGASLLRDLRIARRSEAIQSAAVFPAMNTTVAGASLLLPVAGWPHWIAARAAGTVGAAALILAAGWIDRPWISLVWLLASFVVLVESRVEMSLAGRVVLPALAAVVGAGTAWSGALPAAVPVAAPWFVVTAILVGVSLLPLRPLIAGAAAAVLLIGLAGWIARDRREPVVVEKVLRAGEGYLVDLAEPERVEVMLRGGNLTRLAPDTAVAIVEIAAADGGRRRVLTAADVGDWGSLRSNTWFAATLRGRGSLGPLQGFGRDAFMRYSRPVEFANGSGIELLRVTAHPGLPPDVVVVVESVRTWNRSR